LSGNFPSIAADPVKRQTFANSCVELIETFHFDGVDLDWEYPGYAPQGGTPDDKVNFTLLLQEIRTALDELENQTGQEYLLTSCFGATHDKMESIEWENVLPLLDMVNLMTYDFHGSWDELSNHNTPLYAPAVGDPDWCFHRAYQILHEDFDVPAEKINVGLAFYGKSLANCTQLFGTHTGYDGATFWEDEGVPTYFNILKRMNQFTRYWDDQAKCPYLLGNSVNTFVTYDDCESIGWKAQYVMDHNIAGVIIWEITGDYIETTPGSGVIAGTPLLDTIHTVFDMVTTQSELITAGIWLYPNPANTFVKVICDETILDLKIVGLTGIHQPATFDGNQIDTKNLEPGIYFVKIKTSRSTFNSRLIIQ
jgi:chitinase